MTQWGTTIDPLYAEILASIHAKLYEAKVNVYASTGVADGRGGYGYVLYVRPDQYERAVSALEL